jgi:hypothetical protein
MSVCSACAVNPWLLVAPCLDRNNERKVNFGACKIGGKKKGQGSMCWFPIFGGFAMKARCVPVRRRVTSSLTQALIWGTGAQAVGVSVDRRRPYVDFFLFFNPF